MNTVTITYKTDKSEITLSKNLRDDLKDIWGIDCETFCFNAMDALEKLGKSGRMFLQVEVNEDGVRINVNDKDQAEE